MSKLIKVNKTNWIDLTAVAQVSVHTFSEEPTFEVEFTFYSFDKVKVYLSEEELGLLQVELEGRGDEIST